jgi:glycosyltransferase involved in cell wall biosynthesis
MSDKQYSDKQYKVLVNTSTLMQGGGLQVAAAFIVHALEDTIADKWQFLVSSGVARELRGFGIDPDESRFHVFEESPARNAEQRDRVLRIEAEMQPDLVFTLFGPAYVKFRSRHLCGVADPWVTHSNSVAFRTLGFSLASLQKIGLMVWKAFWWKKVDYWWTEAVIAKDGLVRRLRCDPDKIYVIPNTAGPQFSGRDFRPVFPAGKNLRILCLSAYYSHKNLELIPDVALEIKRLRPNLDFRFIVTLPEDWPEVGAILNRAEQLGVQTNVENLGKVPVSETPRLYEQSHLTFLPSLLEVFSAVYPESFCTGVPLVTTDFRFSRDVCKDAAAYYEPCNAVAAAAQIIRLAEDEQAWTALSARGREVFASLPDAAQKWQLQKKMIQQVAADSA